jgi:hypothetical protein
MLEGKVMQTGSRLVTTLVTVVSLACATTGTTSRCSPGCDDRASASTVVTAAELSRTDGSLMDVLRRTRPWMVARPGTLLFVSVDGSPPADVSLLQSIPASSVQEVRLLRASSSVGRVAVTADGRTVLGDIIAVTTRARSR